MLMNPRAPAGLPSHAGVQLRRGFMSAPAWPVRQRSCRAAFFLYHRVGSCPEYDSRSFLPDVHYGHPTECSGRIQLQVLEVSLQEMYSTLRGFRPSLDSRARDTSTKYPAIG